MKLIVSILFLSQVALAGSDDQCLDMIPEIEKNFSNITLVPGGIEGQIQINKDEKGLKRFKRVNSNILMDAERFPIFSKKRKHIFPVGETKGVLSGIHIAAKTSKTYHTGIEIFNSSISDLESDLSVQLFKGDQVPYYFKNFALEKTPLIKDPLEGPAWLLAHGTDRTVKWSHHSFLFPRVTEFSPSLILNLFFETDFDNSNAGQGYFMLNWFENSFSGPRIDTCVYFMIEKPHS